MSKKKNKTPKITLFVLLAVAVILLVFLVTWLVGELKDTFGDPDATTTAPTVTTTIGGSAQSTPSSTSATTETLVGSEVVQLVESYIRDMRADKALVVEANGQQVMIDLEEVNAPVDYDALEAYMKSMNYDIGLIGQYKTILDTQGVTEEPLNSEYITRKVDELSTKVDTGSDTEYELTETGVIVYRGSEHTVIDKADAKNAIKQALKDFNYETIALETTAREPELPNLEDLRSMIYLPAADAYYDVDADNNTIVVDHVIGYDIDIEAIRTELEEGTWLEKAFAKYEVLPEITTELLPEQYFKDLLGRGSSYYNTYEVNRTTNLGLAAAAINECIVLPGQTFSFNRVVGERTADRGYKPATVFQNGGMQEGLGGGICQVTSTLYVASLNAEMTQVSRYNHAFTVSYVELGMDATVYWGALDYVFRNNTDEPIKIVATAKNGTLTISIYGHETREENRTFKFRRVILETYEQEMIYELVETMEPGTEKKIRNGQPGYKVELYKQIYIDGVLQNEVKVNTSNYKAYNGLTEVGPELPETTPPETTTPAPTEPPVTPPPATETTPVVTEPTTPPTSDTPAPTEPPVAVG